MAQPLHARVGEVTERIAKRSHDSRSRYLDRIEAAATKGPTRKKLGCANFAHGFAACGPDKDALRITGTPYQLSNCSFSGIAYLWPGLTEEGFHIASPQYHQIPSSRAAAA